ncbi:hypothetical protein KC319_g17132 [Hortaea werneckii]|nr:hypothetical protein KC328_g18634 [Hortaea werneckii]KAI7628739.1 hypothetical protein KC319_g17132 [Hortaea werneckii]
MLKTVGTSACERSALSRQRKWLKAPLSLVNAAYLDVGPVAYNIFSALGAQSQSLGRERWYDKTHEAAIRIGKTAWEILNCGPDQTWKKLPSEKAIVPGSLLASEQRKCTDQRVVSVLTRQLKMELRIGKMHTEIQPQPQPQPQQQQYQHQHQRYQPQQLLYDQPLEQMSSDPFEPGLTMVQPPFFAESTHLGNSSNFSCEPEGWRWPYYQIAGEESLRQ